jgi:nucleoside-diphosphate-sugar epimerase
VLEVYGRGYLANYLLNHFSNWHGFYVETKDVSFGRILRIGLNETKGNDEIRYFLNLSGPSSIEESTNEVQKYLTDPLEQVKVHLDYLSRGGFRSKYLFLSSAAVYGDTMKSSASESSPLLPLSPYAHGKILVENYLREDFDRTKIPTIVIRASSIFSSDLEKRVLFRIRSAIGSSEKHVLFGDGNEVRDFYHASDFFKIVMQLFQSNATNSFDIFNVGSGKPISISELVQIAGGVSNLRKVPFLVSFNGIIRDFDPKGMRINVTKLDSVVKVSDSNVRNLLHNYFLGVHEAKNVLRNL